MSKNLKKLVLSLLVLSGLLLYACKKTNNEAASSVYVFEIPEGFPQPNTDPNNPMSNEGIELGRLLYYDTALSYGGPQSGLACASCHFQEYGFTIPAQNVLPHCNLAWSRNFLWKGEFEGTLETIMQFEVNTFFEVDVQHLIARGYYQEKFKKAFGATQITDTLIAKALAQFIRTLVSSDSKYDKFTRGEVQLSASELRGMDMFFSEKGDCFHCHGNAMFTDNDFHNIGLITKSQGDMGRYLITGASHDVGRFKTPGLRNVGLRQSFMHDGRFKTLKEVIQHYNSGVKHTEYLDPLLDKPPLGLTESEISDLEAFLLTLTDPIFISNKKFSNPYKP